MRKWLSGKKAFIVSGLIVASAGAQVYFGSMTIQEFLMSEHLVTMLEGTGLAALRAGLAKGIVIK